MSDDKHTSDEDVFSVENIQCPYPMYEKLREKGPVVWNPRINAWIVTDHALARSVLEQDKLFSSVNSIYGNDIYERLKDLNVDLLITMDGEKHQKTRELLTHAFRLKEVETHWEPLARMIAQEQLVYAVQQETFNVMQDLAIPVPVRVISDMLGVRYDKEKVRQFRELTTAAVTYLGHVNDDRFTEREMVFLTEHQFQLHSLLYKVIEEKKKHPGNDLLSKIMASEFEIDGMMQKFKDEQIFTFLSLLLFAGNFTTTTLITQSLLNLAENPEMMNRVKNDYSLIPAFVEETLRMESPGQAVYRRATANVGLGDMEIKSGDQLLIYLGASGRDTPKFGCPHAMNIDRPNLKDHLSFGYKKHYCIGAGLARMEARVTLEEVLNTFQSFSLPEGFKVEYTDAPLFRGPKALVLDYQLRNKGNKHD